MYTLDSSRFHLFSLDGTHVLIGCNGGLYLIDDDTHALITAENPGGITPEDERIIMELQKIDDMEGPSAEVGLPQDRRVRALCLNLTYHCNLDCIYCFTSSRHDKKSMMDSTTAKRAIDFLMAHSLPEAALQVDFFGGEPLLNFDTLMECTGYAREEAARHGRSINFTVTTNGLLLDERIGDYLDREGFSIILSIDGPPSANDMQRPGAGGISVTDTVLDNIKTFLKRRNYRDYYIRGTYTPDSLDLLQTAQFYLSCGFNNFSLEPARGNSGEPWAVNERHLSRLTGEYRKLALFALKRFRDHEPFNFFHFNIFLDNALCITRRITGCGAGVEYLSIGPRGEIYPCHQLHEIPEFSMGSLFDSEPGASYLSLRQTLQKAHIFEKSGCRECWARMYCSGGCHAGAWFDSGSILNPDSLGCALQKTRLECALWLKAQERINTPQ